MVRATRVKEKLEKSRLWQNVLLVGVLLGPCLVIGDGSLTPAISGTKPTYLFFFLLFFLLQNLSLRIRSADLSSLDAHYRSVLLAAVLSAIQGIGVQVKGLGPSK